MKVNKQSKKDDKNQSTRITIKVSVQIKTKERDFISRESFASFHWLFIPCHVILYKLRLIISRAWFNEAQYHNISGHRWPPRQFNVLMKRYDHIRFAHATTVAKRRRRSGRDDALMSVLFFTSFSRKWSSPLTPVFALEEPRGVVVHPRGVATTAI